jgi:hypothetical protein
VRGVADGADTNDRFSGSICEAVTGDVLFASWHLGSLGTPVAECHAGGVLGALLAWLFLEGRNPHRPL